MWGYLCHSNVVCCKIPNAFLDWNIIEFQWPCLIARGYSKASKEALRQSLLRYFLAECLSSAIALWHVMVDPQRGGSDSHWDFAADGPPIPRSFTYLTLQWQFGCYPHVSAFGIKAPNVCLLRPGTAMNHRACDICGHALLMGSTLVPQSSATAPRLLQLMVMAAKVFVSRASSGNLDLLPAAARCLALVSRWFRVWERLPSLNQTWQ